MSTQLPSDSELLSMLDCPTESETSGNFLILEREFELEEMVPAFERIFRHIRRYGGRMNILYRLVSYSRSRPSVVELASKALSDKSRIVRYHACGALAYSLNPSTIPALRELLSHSDQKTREHAAAAIDAIESKNHHYFADRNHTGKHFWHPDPGHTYGD